MQEPFTFAEVPNPVDHAHCSELTSEASKASKLCLFKQQAENYAGSTPYRLFHPPPPPPKKAMVLGELGIHKKPTLLDGLCHTFHTRKNWYLQRSRYARREASQVSRKHCDTLTFTRDNKNVLHTRNRHKHFRNAS